LIHPTISLGLTVRQAREDDATVVSGPKLKRDASGTNDAHRPSRTIPRSSNERFRSVLTLQSFATRPRRELATPAYGLSALSTRRAKRGPSDWHLIARRNHLGNVSVRDSRHLRCAGISGIGVRWRVRARLLFDLRHCRSKKGHHGEIVGADCSRTSRPLCFPTIFVVN